MSTWEYAWIIGGPQHCSLQKPTRECLESYSKDDPYSSSTTVEELYRAQTLLILLNVAGADGWELVSTIHRTKQVSYPAVMRREIRQGSDFNKS